MTVYCAYGTVIFSLRESDIETCGFSDSIFATKNTHTKPKHQPLRLVFWVGVFELNLYIELLRIAKLPMLTFQTEKKILPYTKKPCHSEEQQGHIQLFNWNCYFTNFNFYNFI